MGQGQQWLKEEEMEFHNLFDSVQPILIFLPPHKKQSRVFSIVMVSMPNFPLQNNAQMTFSQK